jgi:8-oxo-dGTP pyrophosphatase MutT (NUDIX family)
MKRRAAVAVVLRDIGDLKILLVKRKEIQQDPWSGQVALPGGIQKGQEYLVQTAIRETEEETGISLSIEDVVGSLTPTFPKNDPRIEVIPFVFFLSKEPETKPGDEIELCKWVSLKELLLNKRDFELPDGRTVPAFILESLVVWGMTYGILLDLFEFLGDLEIQI